jgi:hypothetical protein
MDSDRDQQAEWKAVMLGFVHEGLSDRIHFLSNLSIVLIISSECSSNQAAVAPGISKSFSKNLRLPIALLTG